MGVRMGLGPKAFVQFANETLLEQAVSAVLPFAEELVVGVPPRDLARAKRLLGGFRTLLEARAVLKLVVGGETRQQTVSRLLAESTRPMLLLHEVARPFATQEAFADVLAAAAEWGAAALFLPLNVRDGVATANGDELERALPRRSVVTLQTPHAYRRDCLENADRRAMAEGWEEEGTAGLVRRAGFTVKLVPGPPRNLKLTYPSDLPAVNEAEAGKGDALAQTANPASDRADVPVGIRTEQGG